MSYTYLYVYTYIYTCGLTWTMENRDGKANVKKACVTRGLARALAPLHKLTLRAVEVTIAPVESTMRSVYAREFFFS